ncbi:esterase [Parabacteroides sp. An277]|uniref:alpha/beta hydrolase n=1 Tax=Parabacteroides sp. An277 TaxID=1965619 RepID=UPI000B3A0778|nr:alpha/beta hydrolase family protein [Parabacteroides sp. An277]OUO53537.1 esterase [Parabacteroides sp. An277]
MKVKYWYVLVCLLCCECLMAASTVRESLSFQSNKLGKEVRYSIYLPDGYDHSTRKYPVLYLLHGWSDNETSWVQMGEVQRIADEAIASHRAAEMIIVMPDAGETWYVNSYDGRVPYEDMFFEELIPYIEKTYRARADREYRAIAGLSMGGYGSFLYTLHHPDMFTACAPLSAAIYTDEQMQKALNTTRGTLFDSIFGKGNLTEHWRTNSVLDLLNTLDAEKPWRVAYYLDCGDEDYLLHGNNIAHEILQEKNIKHELRVRDGGHTWTYWRTALPSVLEFVSVRFRRS